MTCADCDDTQWIRDQIAAKKALVIQLQTQIAARATGAQMYQLDTGQSRQLVSHTSLGQLTVALAKLETEIATLQARLGCGRFMVRPGW